MSLCRTYRMPCRHSRSATGRGPGDFSGQGGSSGSISAHKSSSTIHPGAHILRNGGIVTSVTPDQGTSTRSRYELVGHGLILQPSLA